MSPLKIFVAAASIAALSIPAALAGTGPDNPQPNTATPHAWHMPSKEQMAAWHERMCKDHYAHKAGRLAYLEAALSINDSQRGAFDQWRDAVLADAKKNSESCLARQPGDHGMHHDALARSEHMQKRLETKLAELRSERPALEALYQSLSPDQKKLFDHGDHRGFGHHHGHRMGGHFGEGHGGMQEHEPG